MKETNVIRRAKQRAKTMSAEAGITHQQALDAIAREKGHEHWSAMLVAQSCAGQSGGGVRTSSEAGIDVFAHRWLAMSEKRSEDPARHFRQAAAMIVPYSSISAMACRIIADSAMMAYAELGSDMSGDRLKGWLDLEIAKVREEASMGTLAQRLRAKFDANLPVSKVVSEETMAKETEPLIDDPDGSISNAVMDAVLAALAGEGRISAADGIRGYLSSPGLISAALKVRGDRYPLTDEERLLLVESMRFNGQDEGRLAMQAVAWRSEGMRDVITGLGTMMGRIWCPSLGEVVENDLDAFPRNVGPMRRLSLPSKRTIEEFQDPERPSVFLTWLGDAVEKAAQDRNPFRFNPLDPGASEKDWIAAQKRDVDVLVRLGSQPSMRGWRREMVVDVFQMLIRVVSQAIKAETIGEVAPLSVSKHADRIKSGSGGYKQIRPSYSVIAEMLELAKSDGGDQLALFAMINGVAEDDLHLLRDLGESWMIEALDASLGIMRDPLIAEATS